MIFFLPMALYLPVSSTVQAGLEDILDNHMCWSECQSGFEEIEIREDDSCLDYYTMCLAGCLRDKISGESQSFLETKWQRECVDGAGQWMPMGHNCGTTDASKVKVENCASFVAEVFDPLLPDL